MIISIFSWLNNYAEVQSSFDFGGLSFIFQLLLHCATILYNYDYVVLLVISLLL